jgi:hypothetical protein
MGLEHEFINFNMEDNTNDSSGSTSPSSYSSSPSPTLKDDGKTDSKEMEKLSQIAEIMELLEETHKNKDWVLEKIKQNRIKLPLKPNINLVSILKACPFDFTSRILEIMKLGDFEDFDSPPPLTITYHWFFIDIVASSDPKITTNEQAKKIIVLNKLIENTDTFKQRDTESTLILPTGDGMAIGFSDSPEKPLRLAFEVHKNLYRYNTLRGDNKEKLYIRIGIDTGPVYRIRDLNGKENVWGPGIITARRVMDLAREMNILASARIANDVRTLRPEYKNFLHPIGDYSIKHGEKLLIYNVYGDGFGNKKNPQEQKVQKSVSAQETQKTLGRFIFKNVGLFLDIKDPSTMLTRHTLLWGFINISNEPIDKVFYFLAGDVPRNFPDLNVTIKDEEDRDLDIMSLNINKPYQKEFFVRLRKPIKPQEKRRFVRLEYDWEEPERRYMYTFVTDCKQFDYVFTAPLGMELNQKVLVVDNATGDKKYAPTTAQVKYLADKAEIKWSATNLHPHDAYRFDW